MVFPKPAPWNRETSDVEREEQKRVSSPCSFFFSSGRSLVLAANYFHDDRLQEGSRGGVALKHRHKIHLALFGQLMASFEYMLKDFMAQALNLSSCYDERIVRCKWIEPTSEKVLATRDALTSVGAVLLHSTQGWHNVGMVNARYQEVFERQIIVGAELDIISNLWILRHSVAHNAGYVTQFDSVRLGMPDLGDKVAAIDAEFIGESFNHLLEIARRLSNDVGSKVLGDWHASIAPDGPNYERDKQRFRYLTWLGMIVESRINGLPTPPKAEYDSLFAP